MKVALLLESLPFGLQILAGMNGTTKLLHSCVVGWRGTTFSNWLLNRHSKSRGKKNGS